MTGTTQTILSWSRNYIPDLKTRNKSVRGLDIGRTSTPTGTRETFYLKNSPTGSVYLYIEPYEYTSTSSLSAAATNAKVFMWQAATLSCTFANGSSDKSHKPFKYRPVLAYYEYTERQPYSYTDDELLGFLPQALAYLNNTFAFSYTYTGTGTSYTPAVSNNTDRELVSKALAIIVRRSFVDEQKRRGLGVAVKGPLQAIDTKTQLKNYETETANLEKQIRERADSDRIDSANTGGAVIDLYEENII